jgi:hypothetical protein
VANNLTIEDLQYLIAAGKTCLQRLPSDQTGHKKKLKRAIIHARNIVRNA